MKRRRYLSTAAGLGLVGLAGCLGDSGDGEEPTPSPSPDTPDTAYDTLKTRGESVPLAPTDNAYEWYRNGDLAVVDARSQVAWEQTRIEGAVWSPAPDGRNTDDPAAAWDTDRRILTYCGCPHHLSSQRAASFIANGYTEVYALDEGIQDWIDRGYPIEGERVAQLPTYEISGRTSADAAGREVWVRAPGSGQREVATIGPDGEYTVTFHFLEVDAETPLVLETPEYELRAPLGELTEGVVTASLA
jgi:rhodanese-related sulfurtransferase